MQNSTDLITVLAADGTVLDQSPSIEAVLGYSPEEVTGRSFAALPHASEQGRLLLRLTDGAAGARSHAEPIECLLGHRDGSLRHFEILLTNLLDDVAVGGIVLGDLGRPRRLQDRQRQPRSCRGRRRSAGGSDRLAIGINLSVKQLVHDEIVADVAAALAAASLEPRALTLESRCWRRGPRR